MKARYYFFPLFILYSVCSAESLRPSDRQLLYFDQIINKVFIDSFDQAYELLGDFPDEIDGKPLYNLLYGSILQTEMMDLEDYSKEKVFFSHINTSIDILDKWVEKNPDDAWGFFFLGSAYGYKSLVYAEKHSWLKSLFAGLKAKGRFSDAIKRDSTLYDAYTGMGSYHFWSTVKLRKYLPFLPDNRELGLRELRLAADSSLFSRKPAVTGLAWALMEEKQLSEALRIGRRLYDETKGGRNSLWIIAGVYWRMGNLPLAAQYYNDLLDSFLRLDNQNYYNVIFCRYRIGVCLLGMGQLEKARFEFETILSYQLSKKVKKRHKKTFEKSRDYLKDINKRLSNR